jgi:lysophospholipase L1-like esterase
MSYFGKSIINLKSLMIKRKFLLYLIAIIIPFLICVLIIFAYLRFSYLLVPFKDGVTYELKLRVLQRDGYYKFEPGSYENGQMGSTFTINSDGFRGTTKKSDLTERYSIIALGESSTMGIEVDDDYTWPAILDRLLVARNIDSVVFNAGVGGINSSQMRQMYLQEIKPLKPKVVIYYGGRNDHGLGGGLTRFPGPDKWSGGFVNWLRQFVVYKKAELRYLQYRVFGREYLDFLPSINRWIPTYERNLEQLIQYAKADRTCFVIAQQVMPFDKVLAKYLQNNQFEEARKHFFTERSAWPELFRQLDLYESQLKIARANNIPTVNFFTETGFIADDLFIPNDTVHLSEAGNRFIASQLANEIFSVCPN